MDKYTSIRKKSLIGSSTCLRAAFTCADPKKCKKLLELTVFFVLLGSARVKAARKMLVKLTPGCGELKKKRLRQKIRKV